MTYKMKKVSLTQGEDCTASSYRNKVRLKLSAVFCPIFLRKIVYNYSLHFSELVCIVRFQPLFMLIRLSPAKCLLNYLEGDILDSDYLGTQSAMGS